MLVKSVYGMLLDGGYCVDLAEHPAQAIRQVLTCTYRAVIMDAQAFGMQAEDAARVINAVSPETRLICLGYPESETDSLSIKVPVDLERLRELIHAVYESSAISYT